MATATVDLAALHRREHEVFVEILRVWPDWQECQHGKACVDVKAHWSEDAPWRTTEGVASNATQWFTRTVHADGTFATDADGRVTTFEYGQHSKCPDCGGIDTLTTEQQAWGDRTTCATPGCNYDHWYSVGD